MSLRDEVNLHLVSGRRSLNTTLLRGNGRFDSHHMDTATVHSNLASLPVNEIWRDILELLALLRLLTNQRSYSPC